MSALAKRLNVNLLCVVLAAGLALPTGIGFARAAEQPSAEQIIQALKPPRPTRGLTTSPADAARVADEGRFIDTVRNRVSRSLSTEEREKIASIAKSKPAIDLEINFEFNSATIGPAALPQGRRRCAVPSELFVSGKDFWAISQLPVGYCVTLGQCATLCCVCDS